MKILFCLLVLALCSLAYGQKGLCGGSAPRTITLPPPACTPDRLLEALQLAEEFVFDPNQPAPATLLLPYVEDRSTPAQRLRAQADALERKSEAARRIREILKTCSAK